MKNIEHVLIAYGKQIGYHHGAKYQILSAWRRWYSQSDVSICVMTDRPDLFEGYPIKVIEINSRQTDEWSLGGAQHFGIKLRAFERSMALSNSPISVLLDTDTYWTKNPRPLAKLINEGYVIMFCDEGKVHGTRNTSINRFNEALQNCRVNWENTHYELSSESRMRNSSIIGLQSENIAILDKAFDLFGKLEPLVDAHTVEQFALSEALRLGGFEVAFGSAFTSDWSSIGRKNYVTPILKQFFGEHGENDFNRHLCNIGSISIRRPLNVLFRQKILKLKTKN